MSEEIERLATELRDQAQNYGYSVGLNDGSHAKWQTDFLSADKNLRSAIAALRAERDDARRTAQHWKDEHLAGNAVIERLTAERDALQVHLRAAEEAAGHSEFLSSPLYSTIARIVAERDAAQAEVARLREALQFYADREHLSGDDWSKWDWADPEAANWLCPDSDESLMVEDGWMARAALESKT